MSTLLIFPFKPHLSTLHSHLVYYSQVLAYANLVFFHYMKYYFLLAFNGGTVNEVVFKKSGGRH